MHCVVTAGPTIEPLDQVRRLTNFSTGRLGVDLAGFLLAQHHRVTLLLSRQSLVRPTSKDVEVIPFTTAATLRQALEEVARVRVDAVFHAAAVCDFAFGKLWRRSTDGELVPVSAGKVSTRDGSLMAELVPTPKLIAEMRDRFPDSWLVGWKYEVDGERSAALQAGFDQLTSCRTSACVVNGPAYGEGFGLVFGGDQHVHTADPEGLYAELLRLVMG